MAKKNDNRDTPEGPATRFEPGSVDDKKAMEASLNAPVDKSMAILPYLREKKKTAFSVGGPLLIVGGWLLYEWRDAEWDFGKAVGNMTNLLTSPFYEAASEQIFTLTGDLSSGLIEKVKGNTWGIIGYHPNSLVGKLPIDIFSDGDDGSISDQVDNFLTSSRDSLEGKMQNAVTHVSPIARRGGARTRLDTAKEIKLFDYVVLTSVNRDDLPDGGSGHFAECVKEIKQAYPKIIVEVLIPDFKGDINSLKKIIDAKPEVIAHNIETVQRLQKKIRDPRANYNQSLNVLKNIKKIAPKIFTKSSIMVGVGETENEIIQSMRDLRDIDVDILTIGQYLRPSDWHIPITKYIPPEKFNYLEQKGLELGFKFVASGPFVRSSYKAGELFVKNILNHQKA